MKSNDSFVGAFARSRRRTSSTPEATPEPKSADADLAKSDTGTVETARHDSETSQLRIDPPQDTAADIGLGIQNIQSYLHQAVSVSDTLADSQQVWLEPSKGQLLRVDAAELPELASEPATDEALPAAEEPEQTDAELPGIDTTVVMELFDGATEATKEASVVEASVVEASVVEVAEHVEPVAPAVVTEPTKTKATPSIWKGAAWEVDAFDFPPRVAELFFEEDFFRSIARHMDESIRAGLRSVLVTSLGSGNGRSTVAIGTAVAAAATGLRVALVDADLESPSLADALRLEMDSDWSAAVRQGQPLESAAVVSLDDNLTLIPLLQWSDEIIGGAPMAVTPADVDQLLTQLKNCFDLVIFDGGTIGSWATARIATAVDSSLIVRDTRLTTMNEVSLAADQLRRKGIRGIGVIDNFSQR